MRTPFLCLSAPGLALAFLLSQTLPGVAQNYDFSGALLSASGPASIEIGEPLVITAQVQNTASGFELRRRDWDYSPSWIASLENPSWLKTATNWDFYQYGIVFEGATAPATITFDVANLPTIPGRYTILVNTFYPYLPDAFEVDYLRMDQSPRVVSFSLTRPTKPTIALVSPSGNARLTSSTVAISGTARDTKHTIERVEFQLGDGIFQTADGTTNWSAQIQLAPGLNTLRVRSVNSVGTESDMVTLTLTYVVTSLLTLELSGNGTVTPNLAGQNLEVGMSYSLTAKPAAGYIFSGWSGSIGTNTPALKFVMQNNMLLVANFVPNPFTSVKGAYSGLIYETNGVQAETSGSFAINVTGNGTFSGTIQIGGTRSSLSGQFDADGKFHKVIKRSNLSPLNVDLTFLYFPASVGVMAGSVGDGTWTATLFGSRAGFDGRTSFSPQAGSYTITFPAFTNSDLYPRGDGFGTINVDMAGRIRLAGKLGDGTKLSLSAAVSEQGIWPFYVPLSGGRGCTLGWLMFTNTPSDDMSGDFLWMKPSNASDKYYAAGFATPIRIACSGYTKPSQGINLLDFTDASVVLEGGNLAQAITNRVTLGPNDHVTNLESNNLSLTLVPSTGLFKGSVADPISGKTISFNGAVLQKRNLASGFFIGTSQSGRVSFGP